MASIYKRNDVASNKWYIAYKDEHGKSRVRVGFTDKKQTQRLASELEENARLIREGLVDPGEQRLKKHRERPLDDHLSEYHRVIEKRSSDPKHINGTKNYIKTMIERLEWSKLSHIEGSAFEQELTEMRDERDWSPRTYNAYLVAFRGFTKWLARTGRCSVDPLAALSHLSAKGDVRRRRRELSDDEISRLLAAAATGPVRVKTSGPDRAMLYDFLLGTGVRFGEAMSLTPNSFELDHPDGPRVRVNAGYAKRRRVDMVPLPDGLADRLDAWIKGRDTDKPLWRKIDKACELWMQPDLAAAGIAYKDHNDEVADFHSLRHTFIARMNRGGVPISTAMDLARHSDPSLTLKTYGHISTSDRKAGVEAAAVRGPGASPQTAPEPPARKRFRECAPHAAPHSAASSCTTTAPRSMTPDERLDLTKWLNANRFCIDSHGDAEPGAGRVESTPARTRTWNPLIKSQLLYRLSYGGVESVATVPPSGRGVQSVVVDAGRL